MTKEDVKCVHLCKHSRLLAKKKTEHIVTDIDGQESRKEHI